MNQQAKPKSSPIGNAFKFFCQQPDGTKNTSLLQFKEEYSKLTDADKEEIDAGIQKLAA